MTEGHRILEKEREALRLKIQEVETKYKDSEIRRQSMLFEFEKERAKWGLERDHMASQR